jgi:DNA mismatch endonuclease, patch repair protein
MTDVFSVAKRSKVMSNIRSKNTKPEIILRQTLHKLGYRYRIHVKELPGKPDIVLPKYHTVIQVHGCFWHCHNCIDGHIPKSNQTYWKNKLINNHKNDKKNDRMLKKKGWTVITVWECQLNNHKNLAKQVARISYALEDYSSKNI